MIRPPPKDLVNTGYRCLFTLGWLPFKFFFKIIFIKYQELKNVLAATLFAKGIAKTILFLLWLDFLLPCKHRLPLLLYLWMTSFKISFKIIFLRIQLFKVVLGATWFAKEIFNKNHIYVWEMWTFSTGKDTHNRIWNIGFLCNVA